MTDARRRRVHITDEPMVDPCSVIRDKRTGDLVLAVRRDALLADPEGLLAEMERHWDFMAQHFRPVEAHLRSVS